MTNPKSPLSSVLEKEEISLQSKDGTLLNAVLEKNENPRCAALIVHGYSEHGGRYQHVAHSLHKTNTTTLRLDLRGHGKSEGSRGNVFDFKEYVEDILAGLDCLVKTYPEPLPIGLVCHSNGALAGLRLLADPFLCPKRVAFAALSSPFLGFAERVPPLKKAFGLLASRLKPTLTLRAPFEGHILTHDKDKIAEREADRLCNNVVGSRWFTESVATHAWVQTFAHRIAIPTLWQLAGDDKLVDLDASLQAIDKIDPTMVEKQIYDGFYHEIWNELERDRPLSNLNQWICDQFPISPS